MNSLAKHIACMILRGWKEANVEEGNIDLLGDHMKKFCRVCTVTGPYLYQVNKNFAINLLFTCVCVIFSFLVFNYRLKNRQSCMMFVEY